uniref:(northern house mosquito) hypothetical protein n=1 Tax=Culex pipiens TaxID=7175 RepID=A0A8D8BJ99_CULPI
MESAKPKGNHRGKKKPQSGDQDVPEGTSGQTAGPPQGQQQKQQKSGQGGGGKYKQKQLLKQQQQQDLQQQTGEVSYNLSYWLEKDDQSHSTITGHTNIVTYNQQRPDPTVPAHRKVSGQSEARPCSSEELRRGRHPCQARGQLSRAELGQATREGLSLRCGHSAGGVPKMATGLLQPVPGRGPAEPVDCVRWPQECVHDAADGPDGQGWGCGVAG